MRVVVVVVQILEAREVVVAPSAVGVSRALDVVLGEPGGGGEVPVARVADMMHRRVVFVLLKSALGVEPAITTFTFGHGVQ